MRRASGSSPKKTRLLPVQRKGCSCGSEREAEVRCALRQCLKSALSRHSNQGQRALCRKGKRSRRISRKRTFQSHRTCELGGDPTLQKQWKEQTFAAVAAADHLSTLRVRTLLSFANLKSGCFQSCIIGSTVQPGSPSILSMEARSLSQFARLEQQICAFGRMSNWQSSDPAGTTSKPISGWETGSADPQ